MVNSMNIQRRLKVIDASFIAASAGVFLVFFTPWGATMPGGATILLIEFAAFIAWINYRSRLLLMRCDVCGNAFRRRNAADERTICARCDPVAWQSLTPQLQRSTLSIADIFLTATGSGIVFVLLGVLLRAKVPQAPPMIMGLIGFVCGIAWSLWRWSVLRQGDRAEPVPQAGVDDSHKNAAGEQTSHAASGYRRVATKMLALADWLKGIVTWLLLDLMLSAWIAGALSPYVEMAIVFPVSFFALPTIPLLLIRWRAKRNIKRLNLSPDAIRKLGMGESDE